MARKTATLIDEALQRFLNRQAAQKGPVSIKEITKDLPQEQRASFIRALAHERRVAH